MLKQWIDRRAIALATKALPPPRSFLGLDENVEGLLNDPSLFVPLSGIPMFTPDKNGAFSFPSTVTTSVRLNNIVHGRLFRAGEKWGNRPAVLLVHGWNAELHYLYGCPRLARGLNQRGMDAILFELPYHLQRRPHGVGEVRDFISDDLTAMLMATRQAIADIEALLLWAKSQGSTRTAVWGFSLGAWLTGLHLTHSTTLSAAVLTTPVSNLALAVETLPFCFPIRAALQRTPVPLDRLNLTSHFAKIAADSILVTESLYDVFAPGDTYPALAQKWKLPAWQKVPQSHISILLSRQCMSSAMDWLKDKLIRPP